MYRCSFIVILFVIIPFLLAWCNSGVESNQSSSDSRMTSEASSTEEIGGINAYQGKVFIFITEPTSERWLATGWGINDQAIDTNEQEIPLDCMLHPHAGVVGQWVGGCSGNVRVPLDCAAHIAVMVEGENGGFQVYQVAPPPAYP